MIIEFKHVDCKQINAHALKLTNEIKTWTQAFHIFNLGYGVTGFCGSSFIPLKF